MTKPEICADCAGFDVEWMRRCDKHKTQFCRGCDCPYCEEEEAQLFDCYDDEPLDLEDQLDKALDKSFPQTKGGTSK